MVEPWTLRVALAYPASLAAPCAGLVVLAMSWPAQSAAGEALVFVLVGLAGVVLWTLTEYVLHRWMLHGVEPFRSWHRVHHHNAALPIRVPVLFSLVHGRAARDREPVSSILVAGVPNHV